VMGWEWRRPAALIYSAPSGSGRGDYLCHAATCQPSLKPSRWLWDSIKLCGVQSSMLHSDLKKTTVAAAAFYVTFKKMASSYPSIVHTVILRL
jgi:hypothetical protein